MAYRIDPTLVVLYYYIWQAYRKIIGHEIIFDQPNQYRSGVVLFYGTIHGSYDCVSLIPVTVNCIFGLICTCVRPASFFPFLHIKNGYQNAFRVSDQTKGTFCSSPYSADSCTVESALFLNPLNAGAVLNSCCNTSPVKIFINAPTTIQAQMVLINPPNGPRTETNQVTGDLYHFRISNITPIC